MTVITKAAILLKHSQQCRDDLMQKIIQLLNRQKVKLPIKQNFNDSKEIDIIINKLFTTLATSTVENTQVKTCALYSTWNSNYP